MLYNTTPDTSVQDHIPGRDITISQSYLQYNLMAHITIMAHHHSTIINLANYISSACILGSPMNAETPTANYKGWCYRISQGQKHNSEQCAGKLSSRFLRMGTLLQVC